MWEFLRRFDWLALAVLISFAGEQTIVIVPGLLKEPIVRYCYEGEKAEYKKEGIPSGATVTCREHWVDRNREYIDVASVAVTAIFTAFLGISTYWLWLATKRTADLAREEFIATHRPKIRVRAVQFTDAQRSKPGKYPVSFICRNEGETRAIIINLATAFIGSAVPARITNPPKFRNRKVSILLDVGAEITFTSASKMTLDDNVRSAIATDHWGEFFVGVISYLDGNEVARKIGFARKCDIFGMWKPHDDDEYEYSY